MRPGRRLGIDVGSVRVGVAGCDPEGMIATPLDRRSPAISAPAPTWTRSPGWPSSSPPSRWSSGTPRRLSGAAGAAAEAARAYAVQIARRVHPVGVRLVDERLSTTAAHRRLQEAGVGGRRRRPVVDRVAAVLILQTALDAERASGVPPGTLVQAGLGPEGPVRPGQEDGEQ